MASSKTSLTKDQYKDMHVQCICYLAIQRYQPDVNYEFRYAQTVFPIHTHPCISLN